MKGHGLMSEGAPYAVNRGGVMQRLNQWGVGGYGRGLCRCGAFSELLDSANKRKAWHRAHKAGTSVDHSLTDCECKGLQ